MNNNLLKYLLFCTLFSVKAYTQQDRAILDSTSYYTKEINTGVKQRKHFPFKSYQKFQKSQSYFKRVGDTTMIIKCLMRMSELKFERGNYSLSFDHAWEGLYFSNRAQKRYWKPDLHVLLAKLYNIFNMDEEVYFHLREGLSIAKDIYFRNEDAIKPLISCYMNLAVKERESGNFKTALKYLDSCLVNDKVIENKQVDMPFIDAERGYLMLKLEDYNEARNYLYPSYKRALSLPVAYKTNIAMYLGELKEALNEPDSAIYYYSRSLNYIDRRNFRPDLKPEVLSRLSRLFYENRKFMRSRNYLEQSRKAGDSLLQLKNKTNGELFEIKDSYLQSLYEKNEQLAQKESVIAENKEVQFRLKMFLAFAVLSVIVISVIYRMRIKLKRTLLAKQEAEHQAKLKEEQTKAEIEGKSKELTSYALRLIDKEKDIDELLDVLKNESPSNYKAMSYKYKKGSQDLWDSFNLRFTEVNDQFYTQLKAKHPDLSATERKHCALIKLKFGTKEMARILNIATHSVHISRSRIRKKIGLERSESLEDYIASF